MYYVTQSIEPNGPARLYGPFDTYEEALIEAQNLRAKLLRQRDAHKYYILGPITSQRVPL